MKHETCNMKHEEEGGDPSDLKSPELLGSIYFECPLCSESLRSKNDSISLDYERHRLTLIVASFHRSALINHNTLGNSLSSQIADRCDQQSYWILYRDKK